jgi:hypothetical protein
MGGKNRHLANKTNSPVTVLLVMPLPTEERARSP